MPAPSSNTDPKTQLPPERSAGGAPCEVELLDALRQGNRDALAKLYDQHAVHVYTLAYRILRNGPDAESVVSDVFYEVWRLPERIDASRGSCRAYLQVMARSRALDLVRRESRQTKAIADGASLRALQPDQQKADYQPEVVAIRAEQQLQVQDAIQRLDTKQSQPLRLAYFGGLTHREIADRLGEPLGTIKTRIRAALHSLRESLRKEGRHDDELP